jgi:FkbM family methyltransferase
MKPFTYKYDWTDRTEWMLPDDEEMMKGQFPILDEQIDTVLDAVVEAGSMTGDTTDFRTCVQAGGAFGMYPLRLCDYFQKVWTFEPLLANLECLHANVRHGSNITISPTALWHEDAKLWMDYSKPVKNSYGAHHVSRTKTSGEIVVANPLDIYCLNDVDLLWLDIEGAEVYALMGACKTIRRCNPVIVIEEAKHLPQHRKLDVRLDSASSWLKRNGYKECYRTHGDLVFIPA